MSASACSRSMTDSVYYFMSDKKFHVYLCPFRTRSWRRHCPIHDVEMAAAAAYSDQRQRPLVAERPTASQSSLCSIVSIADAVTRAAEAGHGCDADVERERERERERRGERESADSWPSCADTSSSSIRLHDDRTWSSTISYTLLSSAACSATAW